MYLVLGSECYSGLGEFSGYNMQTNPSFNPSSVTQASSVKPRPPYTISYSNPMFDNYGGSAFKSSYDYNRGTVKVYQTPGDLGAGGRGSYYSSAEAGSNRYTGDVMKKKYQSSKPF